MTAEFCQSATHAGRAAIIAGSSGSSPSAADRSAFDIVHGVLNAYTE